MGETPTRSHDTLLKRRHRLAWGLAGLVLSLLVVLVGAAALWSYRLDLLTWTAERILERRGLGPVRLVVDQMDLHGVHAHDISLRGGAIRAAELTLAYNLIELAVTHLDQVDITGLQLILAADDGAVTLGGRPLGTSTESNAASLIGGLRIDSVKITDAHLALDGPRGRLEAAFSGQFALASADVQNAAVSIDIMASIAGARHALQIAAPTLALLPQDGGGVRLLFENATIVSKDAPWTAEDIDGELIWGPGIATTKVTVNRLINRQQPALVVPIRILGKAAMAGQRVEFTLHVENETAGAKGKVSLTAKGHHDRSSDSGETSIAMGPVVFRAGGMQPGDVFPILGPVVAKGAGTVALSGLVRWRDGALSPDLVVHLADVALEPPGVRLSRINGDIEIVQLWPPATPPGQMLTASVQAGKLPANSVKIGFELRSTAILMVERIQLDIAGGQITTSPFAIDPKEFRVDTVLQFEQVDLAEVYKLIGVDELSGTGRLDGHIPLNLDRGRVRVSDGRLVASVPGILRFKSSKLPKEITGAGEEVGLALRVLEDFHYESLILELNKSATGEGAILLSLRGSNPSVLEGRPFNFNIRFESNFDNLTDLALRSMAFVQEILRRAEKGVGP